MEEKYTVRKDIINILEHAENLGWKTTFSAQRNHDTGVWKFEWVLSEQTEHLYCEKTVKNLWKELMDVSDKIENEVNKIKKISRKNQLIIYSHNCSNWDFSSFYNINRLILVDSSFKEFPKINDNIEMISLVNTEDGNSDKYSKVVLSHNEVNKLFKDYPNLNYIRFNWLYSSKCLGEYKNDPESLVFYEMGNNDSDGDITAVRKNVIFDRYIDSIVYQCDTQSEEKEVDEYNDPLENLLDNMFNE